MKNSFINHKTLVKVDLFYTKKQNCNEGFDLSFSRAVVKIFAID